MSTERSKLDQFANWWIRLDNKNGMSAIAALILNFFILLLKLAVIIPLLIFSLTHDWVDKVRKKTGVGYRIIQALLTFICLVLDLFFVAMLAACGAIIISGFEQPFGIIIIICDVIAVFLGWGCVTVVISSFKILFGKNELQPENTTMSANSTISPSRYYEYEDDLSEELEEDIATQVFNKVNDVDQMNGTDFEHFCADLLRINGYTDVRVTAGAGDHGIDLIAIKDEMQWGFQCKRWGLETHIGNDVVRDTFAGKAYYHCDIGVIIATTAFTRKAEEYAKETGILLWGRDKLYRLIEKMYDTAQERQ